MTTSLLIILAVITAVVTLYIVLPSVAKVVLRRRFLGQMSRTESACLTFDDGPDPEVTPALLDLLDEAKVKATFFVVGKKAAECPQLVARMIAGGHEVGEHTNEHYFPWTSGPLRATKDLWACKAVLDGLHIDEKSRLFRPPFGKLNLIGLIYIGVMHRRIAFWNVDPQDFKRSSGEEVASLVKRELAPGAVVLLHDGTTRSDDESGRPVVVEALRRILNDARDSGVAFALLGAVMSGQAEGGSIREETLDAKHSG